MVCNSTNPETFAPGITGNRGKVRMKGRADIRIDERPAIFCTEDQMHQNKGERLGHSADYKSGLQGLQHNTWGFTPGWYKAAPLALTLALATSGCAQSTHSSTPATPATPHKFTSQSPTKSTQPQIQILILNAKTNHPITDERLNVALKQDQIGSVAMPTDKHGIIEVDTGDATILRILANMYADCRPRAELYTNYSIDEIRTNGITTGNLCSAAHPKPQPGELILFEIPKTYVPKNPNAPITHLPHSDEYPN
ncbi:hypothetical protein GCM10011507_14970 [Edaphobacter acidisoli]|uniref:Uncharacterized protein n=3 Tax=Edaphobacter acidisoli TaxID=2040573 RepID=A0A916RPW3_9BACT|nr:hypothetical protein GCM10011507_14970 [Edaphobacter acidisoli]